MVIACITNRYNIDPEATLKLTDIWFENDYKHKYSIFNLSATISIVLEYMYMCGCGLSHYMCK